MVRAGANQVAQAHGGSHSRYDGGVFDFAAHFPTFRLFDETYWGRTFWANRFLFGFIFGTATLIFLRCA